MRLLFLSIFLFSFSYASLQGEITSNAQQMCYLKNPNAGIAVTDYSPVVTGQSFIQSIKSIPTNTAEDANCNLWNTDPYVVSDTETFSVIANMDCTVDSRQVNLGDGTTTTEYWTVENQYILTIDCQANCEIPKDSTGKNYELVSYITETDCSTTNLQQLLDTNNPNSGYIIDDAQYLICSSNVNLTGCYYKKHVEFAGNIDNNSTDNNTTSDNNSTDNNITDNNASLNNATDLTDTNNKLDAIGAKVDANGQRLDTLGTKLDTLGTKIDANGQGIDNLGVKIDANGARIEGVTNAVIGSGNYIGSRIDALGNTLSNEFKSQGDRLHNDLQDLKSSLNDSNSSNGFDDSRIIDAIHKNTDAIKEIKDMHEGEIDADTSFFDTYQGYYDDMTQSIDNVENNVNDLMATIQGDYTPSFQNYNSCVVYFPIYGKTVPYDMCKYSPILKPYLVFILTISMLILLIRLHFYLFPKVMRSD